MSERDREGEERRFLCALADDAVGEKGWCWRGVRGWRFTDELSADFPLLMDHLKSLAERGYVQRDDVLDPGRSAAWYLNRVTIRGEDFLGGTGGWVPRPIGKAGELTALDRETLFIARSAWAGLVALSALTENDGWVPMVEVGCRTGRPFCRNDAASLITRGLMERTPPVDVKRTPRGSLHLRATRLGRGAKLIDGTTSTMRVQIHVPGIAPPPRSSPVMIHHRVGPLSGG